MGFEQLTNKGFSFLNLNHLKGEKRQIIIIGSARGGTSLVAGALYHLGVFTGEKSYPPVFEDLLLSEAFESKNLVRAQKIIDNYSNQYNLWAWKRPAALNYLTELDQLIPNPLYIFIFKDIFSIANRNNISMKSSIVNGLNNALVDYGKMVDFISKTNKPTMLVSAEKALLNKKEFIDALVNINEEYLQNIDTNSALNFIEPNPKNYLDASRITKAEGRVGGVINNHIVGYAMYVHNKAIPAEVELYINDELHLTTVASQLRPHLLESGKHPTGKCGFVFAIDEKIKTKGNFIKIKAKDEVVELDGGQFFFDEKFPHK